MKVFYYIIFLFSLFSTYSFSENQFLNNKEWVYFMKKFNDEKFSLTFPEDPVFNLSQKDAGSILSLSSSKDNVHYNLEVLANEGEDYFTLLLNHLQNDEVKILSSISTDSTLDLFYKDLKSDLFCKIKVIITPINVYYFFTTFKEDTADLHEYFVSSFQVMDQVKD